uniref:PiggyBac transposable element-derived protein domain-containing protein n=1 Tax=Clastoptera arizonana TaxID=38151 RepID=A0A1B6CEU0_9HEMI
MLRPDEISQILQEMSDDDDVGELPNNDDFPDFDGDLSDENIEFDVHSDDSECDGDNDDFSDFSCCEDFVLGKDLQTIWSTTEIKSKLKTPNKNIVKKFPGPKPKARNIKTEVDALLQFIDTDMLDTILTYTNLYIDNISVKYTRERDCLPTTKTELMALFGVLYLLGLRKSNRANVQEIWASNGTGIQIIRAVMSYKRFLFLLRCLRFDNTATRVDRCREDKLAAIRSILDPFVRNCVETYNPSEYVTIDEMLHAFRGRCSFIQYMPSKPAKYGIKIFALCDAKTFFCSNLEVYCGTQPAGSYKASNKPEDIVKRLVIPIEKSKKNLTTDNWYTSIPLVEDMLAKGITMIGTLKKNKAAIPPSFFPNKQRQVGSSAFGFSDDKTMVSFVPKVNKAVILVSSMHDTKTIDPVTNKPDIILDYNKTKGGVDTCDKMCAAYSVSRVTRRWPQAIFYVLMNISGINARVLHSFTNPKNIPRRRIFQKNLALDLMKGHLAVRSKIKSLPKDIYLFLERYREEPEQVVSANEPPARKRGTCWLCGRQRNSSASTKCGKCSRFVCKHHGQKQTVCQRCGEDEEGSD